MVFKKTEIYVIQTQNNLVFYKKVCDIYTKLTENYYLNMIQKIN